MVENNTTTKNVETNREQNIPTREKVYNFICEFIQQNSISPSIRDIAAGVGLNSPSTVASHLKRLEAEGRITHLKGASRSLIVVGKPTPVATEPTSEDERTERPSYMPPVGHWEFINDYEARCTHCGKESYLDHNEPHDFCPKCGAEMQ